ncbi:unnamed protein product [Calicophoron daubneyi]|uniref:Reticulon-like protein n=1 Tax=Calicophoron daubneyi TaxID=300641 RepID=A0AAV2TBZ2_CALDB
MSTGSPDSGPKVVEKCPMKEEARSLIFWRKPVRSGIVLAVLLAFQFSFVYLSAISVVAYAGLLLFASTNFYRLYYQYIAKSESKLIKEYIEREISLPEDRIADVSLRLTDMLNRWIAQAREIFLLTNIAASVKFGVLLYLMTYVGARFNFLTLCILGTVLVFSVPKFYESYQREIDHAWDIVREKLDKVVSLMNSQLNKVPGLGSRKQKAQ